MFFLFGLAYELVGMSVVFALLILLWLFYIVIRKPTPRVTVIGTLMLCALYLISAISLVCWEFWAQDEMKGLHKSSGPVLELIL